PDRARDHFDRARDLDALRFRADSRINDVIRRIADEDDSGAVDLVDLVAAFAANSEAESPGEEFFLEHVHFSFPGNYEVARALLPYVVNRLPDAVRGDTPVDSPAPTQAECARWLAMTGWDQRRILERMWNMMSRPPFTDQSDHQAVMQRLAQRQRALRKHDHPVGLDEAVLAHQHAIEARPNDPWLRQNVARLLGARGRFAEAARQWQDLLAMLPNHAKGHYQLGVAFLRTEAFTELAGSYSSIGLYDEAEAACREGLTVHEDDPQLLNELGAIHVLRGELRQARRALERALNRHPEYAEALYNLGLVDLAEGRRDEGIERLKRSADLEPFRARTHVSLSNVYLRHQDRPQAMEHMARAVEVAPEDASIHTQYAHLLAQAGRLPEAAQHHREALSIQPDHTVAISGLARILATAPQPGLRDPDQAVQLAERLAGLSDQPPPPVLMTLALAYASAGRFDDAIDKAQQALTIAQRVGNQSFARQIAQHLDAYRRNIAPFDPEFELVAPDSQQP
ncbi:MAG: tetratricopeptide repeat protein, partial [Planctomycetota bacterium]